MTLNLTSLPKATARCACRYGALLLPLLAVKVEALVMPQRVTVIGHGSIVVVERPAPVPYLVAVGPIAFRFAPALPPQAEPPPLPPAAPKLVSMVAAPTPPPPPQQPVVAVLPVKVEPPQEIHETSTVAPILPDDTRREIRAEDVLPFFQFPNSNAASGGGVPPPFAPAQPRGPALPPSSATYQQK